MRQTQEEQPALRGKQREFLRREQEILNVARDMLLENGIIGLAMNNIAEAIGYATGTVYQHFPCKEEIVLALAIETAHLRLKLLEKAARLEWRARERMLAMGEVTAILFPRHFHSELLLYTNALRVKTTPERQEELRIWEARCFSMGVTVVQDAVESGDLVLPKDLNAESFYFGLSSMVFGVFGILNTDVPLDQVGVTNAVSSLHAFGKTVLDGFGWRPLSTEWDYRKVMKRVYTEVFPEELRRSINTKQPDSLGSGVDFL
jgi:AcrR family transcriptional regulator